MELNAFPKSIEDTLSLQRKYIIPRFQREYSWENEELSELFEDLLDNIHIDNNGVLQPSEYFIGSLVLVGDEDNTTSIERYVVDGQQRLTTITILFSVIARKFKDLGEEKLFDKTHSYIIGEDNDGTPYSKLVNEMTKPYFQMRIQQKEIDFSATPKTQEDRRILSAYNYFDKQLKETALIKSIRERNPSLEEYNYVQLLKLIRDQVLKCKVIYVTVKSLEDAYEIFEVLNAKGKDLEPVDMIKNTIFSVVTNQTPLDNALELWQETKNSISSLENCDFSSAYRHYWLSKYCLSTSKKLVANFSKYIKKEETSYLDFLRDLKINMKYYVSIAHVDEKEWKQPEDLALFTSLNALNTFNVTQTRILLLALLDVKDRKLISHKNFKKILLFLEHYHFIFTAVCSSRPSGLERRYSLYARNLRNCSTKEETAKEISNLIADMSLPEYNVFETHFLELRFTSYQEKDKKIIQYILKKIERYYAGEELKPNSFTIEHVLPESIKTDYVGMIGNLLPLGSKLNEDLANKELGSKLEGYRQSQYTTVKQFVEKYSNCDSWNKELIIQRTKELAKILYDKVIEG